MNPQRSIHYGAPLNEVVLNCGAVYRIVLRLGHFGHYLVQHAVMGSFTALLIRPVASSLKAVLDAGDCYKSERNMQQVSSQVNLVGQQQTTATQRVPCEERDVIVNDVEE